MKHERNTMSGSTGTTRTSGDGADSSKPKNAGLGWKIATGVLALTTIAAGAWAISLNSEKEDLQAQVSSLETTVGEQSDIGTTIVLASEAQIQELQDRVANQKASLEQFKSDAADALASAQAEYDKVVQQLQASEQALEALKAEIAKPDTDRAAVASAYEQMQSELAATQEAFVELLDAVAAEIQSS
jgi:chromosome segregation ATPase